MRKKLLVVFAVLTGASAFSQTGDTTHYHLNYTGAGTINKTNDGESYIFNNMLRFNITRKKIDINTSHGWIYGQDAVSKTNNDYYSIADINYLKDQRRLYYWALGSYERTYSLKIIYRIQAGAGLGYNLVKQKAFRILISDGIIDESSSLSQADKYGRLKYQTLRNSARLKFHYVFKDLITIDGSDFLQNSLSDHNDYIIKSSTVLSFRLRKWLSVTTTVNYNRLNLTGEENLLINYGLSFEKSF